MDETDVDRMDFQDAYDLFVNEAPKESTEYAKVRYGVKLKFDVYDYFHDLMTVKEKTGWVIHHGKKFKLTDLWTEVEERAKICKAWLKDNVSKDAWRKTRGTSL